MSKGVIELVLEDKGEEAVASEITPQEFFDFSFELSWAGYATLGAAVTVGAGGGLFALVAAPFVGLSFITWGTIGGSVAVGAGVGASLVALINYMSDILENLIEFKPEDYSYFINRYREFEEDRRQGIATALLVKIKKKLIERENITEDEKRFY